MSAHSPSGLCGAASQRVEVGCDVALIGTPAVVQAEEANANAARLLKQKERLEGLCRTLQQRASEQSTALPVTHQGTDAAGEAWDRHDASAGDDASSEVERPIHGECEQGDRRPVVLEGVVPEEAAEGGSIAVEPAAAASSVPEATSSTQASKGPAATYREPEACESIMIVPASSSLQCKEPLLQDMMSTDDSFHTSHTACSQTSAALPQKLV